MTMEHQENYLGCICLYISFCLFLPEIDLGPEEIDKLERQGYTDEIGSNHGSVCLSLCVSVCLSDGLSVCHSSAVCSRSSGDVSDSCGKVRRSIHPSVWNQTLPAAYYQISAGRWPGQVRKHSSHSYSDLKIVISAASSVKVCVNNRDILDDLWSHGQYGGW